MAIKEVKIEIMNDKQEVVVYKTNFIPARKVREALEINEFGEKKGTSEVQLVDKMISYTAGLFEGVTEDMILDGIASWELMTVLQETMGAVLGADPKETANL